MKKTNKLSLVAACVLLLGVLQSKAEVNWWSSVPCVGVATVNYVEDIGDCHALEYLDISLCTISTFFQFLGGVEYDPNFTSTLKCYDVAAAKEQRCEVSARYDAINAIMDCVRE